MELFVLADARSDDTWQAGDCVLGIFTSKDDAEDAAERHHAGIGPQLPWMMPRWGFARNDDDTWTRPQEGEWGHSGKDYEECSRGDDGRTDVWRWRPGSGSNEYHYYITRVAAGMLRRISWDITGEF